MSLIRLKPPGAWVLAKAGTDFHHYAKESLAVVGHEMINAFDACSAEHVGGN